MSEWRLFVIALALISTVDAAAAPVAIGIGAGSCQRLLETLRLADQGKVRAVANELRYRSWMAGFVSGLSVAGGEDVSRGVPLEGLMRQLRFRCQRHPGHGIAETATGLLSETSRLPPVTPTAR